MKLNIGCGKAKIEGFINLDINPDCKPDVVHDFKKGLPYPPDYFDEIVMFHCIEHIEKRYHEALFLEVKRTLKSDGFFILTFPDFERCVQGWLTNHKGQRAFYEAAIYGRQLYPSDYHVALCTVDGIARTLARVGLDPYWQGYEKNSEVGMDCNGIIKAKVSNMMTYEQALKTTVFGDKEKVNV